ncbi:MAG: hypothetical protein V5A38_13990 [Halolamina sp.]|uniref:rod-determining factor RdfA n=1 Tax=Halolamina sp. TaxID=1940283 RepID=UPI002FC3B19A
MSEENEQGSNNRRRGSKVGRLIESYELEGMPAELARYWLGEGVERQSLRELATLFNERLVRAAMQDAGMSPLEGEAANVYELLSGDSATSGARTRAERRLGRKGVDVEQLTSEFVSHQAIHTYLTDVRGLEHTAETEGVESRIETVQRLVGRTRSVSAGVVEGLAGSDEIDIGEFEVTADVYVTCRDCNSRYELTSFLRRGQCDCE